MPPSTRCCNSCTTWPMPRCAVGLAGRLVVHAKSAVPPIATAGGEDRQHRLRTVVGPQVQVGEIRQPQPVEVGLEGGRMLDRLAVLPR